MMVTLVLRLTLVEIAARAAVQLAARSFAGGCKAPRERRDSVPKTQGRQPLFWNRSSLEFLVRERSVQSALVQPRSRASRAHRDLKERALPRAGARWSVACSRLDF